MSLSKLAINKTFKLIRLCTVFQQKLQAENTCIFQRNQISSNSSNLDEQLYCNHGPTNKTFNTSPKNTNLAPNVNAHLATEIFGI